MHDSVLAIFCPRLLTTTIDYFLCCLSFFVSRNPFCGYLLTIFESSISLWISLLHKMLLVTLWNWNTKIFFLPEGKLGIFNFAEPFFHFHVSKLIVCFPVWWSMQMYFIKLVNSNSLTQVCHTPIIRSFDTCFMRGLLNTWFMSSQHGSSWLIYNSVTYVLTTAPLKLSLSHSTLSTFCDVFIWSLDVYTHAS